mmetsp:Transcript_294/g.907  ORF Transcript_294/g.907 Transcript_294/m.907 type:complete len:423 (+) Transcript_294:243-1511(+)
MPCRSRSGAALAHLPPLSVVEEAHARVRHDHPVLVRRGGDRLVLHGAPGVHQVVHAEARGRVDVVAEGEEGVRGDAEALEVLLEEGGLVLRRQGLHRLREVALELGEGLLGKIPLDVRHAGVDALLALDPLLEGQAEHLGVCAEGPRLRLAARQLDAVHARLLARTHAHHLARGGVAHGVGLGVLDADLREHEVPLGPGREVLVLGDHGGERGGGVDDRIVAALLEARAAELSALQGRGLEARAGLEDDEGALLLGLEDLQGRLVVVRRDDPVRDLRLEELRRLGVHRVGERGKVAKGAERVRLAGAEVGVGRRGQGLALHLVHALQLRGQGLVHRGPRGAHVLEAGGRGHPERGTRLLHELPCVEGVQEVDVPGLAVDHLEGEGLPADAGDGGRHLLRVAPVLERGDELGAGLAPQPAANH